MRDSDEGKTLQPPSGIVLRVRDIYTHTHTHTQRYNTMNDFYSCVAYFPGYMVAPRRYPSEPIVASIETVNGYTVPPISAEIIILSSYTQMGNWTMYNITLDGQECVMDDIHDVKQAVIYNRPHFSGQKAL